MELKSVGHMTSIDPVVIQLACSASMTTSSSNPNILLVTVTLVNARVCTPPVNEDVKPKDTCLDGINLSKHSPKEKNIFNMQ